jgi:ferric-dicitrate binding protein FerR (iron transport regulator)
MNCEAVCESLGAWIDRQLPADEAAALEAHLATCGECRAAAEALRAQDAELLRAFQPGREAARRVAESAIAELHRDAPVAVADRPGSNRKWVSLVLAATAGFLLAIFLFPPWKRSAVDPPAGGIAGLPPTIEPVAKLVVATGNVEVQPPGASTWQSADYVDQFLCPSNGVVRTGPNVQCEWQTTDGSVIRLNGDTQIRFASAGVVEVERGQIACSSPTNGSLKVVVPERAAAAASPWFMCQSQSSAVAAIAPDGNVQVTAAAGEVALQTSAGSEPLRGGESVRLVEGRIVKGDYTDPLLATAWTGALLVRKGHDDAELAARVDQLLARLGQSKVSLLYEEEIRALGEYAVLPLVKFVESPLSQESRTHRQQAITLVSDLAPTWAIPDLIKLLSDPDAYVRSQAARALQRLTGRDQGRTVDGWREPLENCAPTIDAWQMWWQLEHPRYPPRKAGRET